ncbi:PEP/pyruvate-binding domain-containing protein [Noviherbaspirillum sp. ST9]|uniref:PEP/pyruvate-binding domain-containing protein n=1 Tax=Noviherbaspirillum sp. ST9 TaxID=3401606 RepID=UPI003B588C98
MNAAAPSMPLLDWDAAATQREEAGGKGWQLGLLARYGLPVPEGFVIPASVYRKAVRENGDALAHCRLDNGVIALLNDELARRGWLETPLAVRSSATMEDSAQASFAGIHLTRLNVTGIDALLDAVRAVWASLWTPQAVAYRDRFGIAHADAAMAVVVMPLLPARAAGIAFSCDPRAGRDDRIIVHAHWGLGESLVGGEADGDEYVLHEDVLDTRLSLGEKRIGSKARKTVMQDQGGTHTIDTPRDEAARQVLDDAQALLLGTLVRDAASALDFGRPFYDVEWVWDGERFWIVQARPVTAIARNTYPAIASQPTIWTNGNSRDVMPLPMSALDWCGVRRLVNELLEAGYRHAGYPLLPGTQRAACFNGRLYLNLSLLMWEAWDGFGVPPKIINEMAGGHQPEIAVPPDTLRDKLRRIPYFIRFARTTGPVRKHAEQAAASAMALAKEWKAATPPHDPVASYTLLLDRTRTVRGQRELGLMQGSGGASLSMLVGALEKHFPGEANAMAAALLAGGTPSVTAQQGYDLMSLAEVAERHPEVQAWLTQPGRDDNGWRALAPEHPFRRGFADFLDRYGHRGVYESYWRHQRWHDTPGYLLDTIAGLIGTRAADVRARQEKAREQAWQRARAGMPWHARQMLKFFVASAVRDSNQRELARSTFAATADALRGQLLHLGRALMERGALVQPEHIVELTLPEIGLALRGVTKAQGVANRVEDRLAQRAYWEAVHGPDVIQVDGPPVAVADVSMPATGKVRTGVAVGAGIARGIARVIRDPRDGTRLNQGEILVAPSTDPAWTPLFLKVGGLVMETGGYLSHGAIVAREFAIPAVVNMPGILEQIRDGDVIEVDGSTGRVRLA